MIASTLGKIELETMEDGREGKIHDDIIKRAVLNVFDRYFGVSELEGIVAAFETGGIVETGAELPAKHYMDDVQKFEGFGQALNKLGIAEDGPAIASAMEFILEGLHLNRRLNKERRAGGARYAH